MGKKAVLLSFRLNDNAVIPFERDIATPLPYGYDKVPLKWADWGDNRFRDAGFGSFPAPWCAIRPSSRATSC